MTRASHMLARVRTSAFAKAVLMLAGGTALAQAVPIVISPALTRLYTPEDFGRLSLFTAIVSSIGMAVCGRFDMAMLLPRRLGAARQLLGLALWIGLLSSLAALAVIAIAPDTVRRLLGAESLGDWALLVPLALMLTGLRVTLTYWANRSGDFPLLVKTQWTQALVAAAVGLGLGTLGAAFPGLLAANLLALLAASVLLGTVYLPAVGTPSLGWSRRKLALMRRYKSYPLFSASSAVVDGVTMSLPVFFLAQHFSDSVLGHYSLVLRVASAPLSFVSSAVAQVHLKQLLHYVHAGQDASAYLRRLAGTLAVVAAVPAALLMPFAPWLFETAFGAAWREAGVYFQILMPSLAIRFVATTISGTIEATNNTHLGAAWKVAALVVTAAVLATFSGAGDIVNLLIALAVSDSALYLAYAALCFRASRSPRLGGT